MSPRGHGRQPRRGGPTAGRGGRPRKGGRPSERSRPRETELATPPRTHVVGVVERSGRFLTIAPLFERGRGMSVAPERGARPGMLVLVRVALAGRGHDRIERVLGDPSIARDVIEALMLQRGLARRFPPGVTTAAAEARDRMTSSADADPAAATRSDLRDLPTFTIDPVTAKDFDDAISAERLDGDRIRVWVHIADVSAFVRPGSPVDRVAMERGTSVYVPGKVEPMLPEALSNEACSLVPGEDRLAVTVEMDFEGATVVRAAFHRTLIRSDERLDYDRVDRILDGREQAQDPWARPLDGGSRSGPRPRSAPRGRRAGADRRVLGAAVRVRPQGQRRRAGAQCRHRVPPAHRAPDDRGQRAGRHAS